jgi:hypothetical protein
LYGAYPIDGKLSFKQEQIIYCIEEYQRKYPREAIYENGDVIKYREGKYDEEKEWIFFIHWLEHYIG